MDVVLVVVDALRHSEVSCYDERDATTPNIDRIGRNGTVFESAYSQSNYTDVCLSAIMSGRPPRENGVRYHGTKYTEENVSAIETAGTEFLPQTLSEHGVTTIGMDWMGRWHKWGYDEYGIGDEGGSLRDEAISVLKAFAKQFPDPLIARGLNLSYRLGGVPDPRADCEELTDLAIETFDRYEEDDRFMFVHYWDVHPPYLPPDEHEEQFTFGGRDEPLSSYYGRGRKPKRGPEYAAYVTGQHQTLGDSKEAYDGAVHWVDEQVGRLYDHVTKDGAREDTLFVVTADHGHFFGEHDIFADNCSLYEESVHVPLVLDHPCIESGRVSGLVQHTDLRPTIEDFLDVPSPEDLRGNVLPEVRKYAFSEAVEGRMQMLRTEQWKLVRPLDRTFLEGEYWYDREFEPELYDLEEDPHEEDDVASANPEVVSKLERLLDEEVKTQEETAAAGAEKAAESIDESELEEVRSNLASLGYLDER